MKVLEAAQYVLAAVKTPLHSDEITEQILDQKLWTSKGETPAATVAACISADIKHKATTTAFERVAPSTFKLRDGLTYTSSKNNSESPSNKPKMTFVDAAFHVLSQHSNKQPMHYAQIAKKAMKLRLIRTQGKTPEATMYARILIEIGRHQKQGKQPRFSKLGKGLVGIAQWTDRDLASKIEQHNKKTRAERLKHLLSMDWKDFEKLVGHLLAAMGFDEVETTPGSSDGGIDVRGRLVVGDVVRTRMAVQVKRWKKNVQVSTVREVRGSLSSHEQGLIITTSGFSRGAQKEANHPNKIPINLMTGEQFVLLLVEYGIGFKISPYQLIEIADDFA